MTYTARNKPSAGREKHCGADIYRTIIQRKEAAPDIATLT
jgi:hypothetical protein